MSSFNYLLRFVDSAGQTRYGNLAAYKPTSEIVGSEVNVLSGSIEEGFSAAGETATVASVRFPPSLSARQPEEV
jgi:hypothetical protein